MNIDLRKYITQYIGGNEDKTYKDKYLKYKNKYIALKKINGK